MQAHQATIAMYLLCTALDTDPTKEIGEGGRRCIQQSHMARQRASSVLVFWSSCLDPRAHVSESGSFFKGLVSIILSVTCGGCQK